MNLIFFTLLFGGSAFAALSVAVYHQIRETKCEIKNAKDQPNLRGCK